MWVVVVEPYYDGSHRAWADGYAAHSAHDVTVITHQGSFWKWRMHGAALTLAHELDALVAERGAAPDAVVISDMADVSSFRGLARSSLRDCPVVAYFHENQLTYPLSPSALPDLSYGMRNWLSMAAADEIWFNSAYHRDEVTRALPALLGSMPDHRHNRLIDEVLARTCVMPVGIAVPPGVMRDRRDSGPPIVLWNQRWEYDKNPARFFAAVDRAADRGTSFRLCVAGQNFRSRPAEFEAGRIRHASRLVHFGEADPATYRNLLDRCDVVVSTARHEFFGVAVAEAIAAGCSPVLPNALAYPELVGEAFAHVLYDDDEGLDQRLDRTIRERAHGGGPDPQLQGSVVARYAWATVASDYDRRLAALVSC